MAALSDTDREYLWGKFMDEAGGEFPFTKPELRAAVNALDDWIDGNAAAINAALPEAFRSTASQGQKATLFAFVALRRYEVI